jgi:hypothetical protein
VIVGPAAIVLPCAPHLRKEQNGGDLSKPSIQEDLFILILSHFARYWDIGRLLLGEPGWERADLYRFCSCISLGISSRAGMDFYDQHLAVHVSIKTL